MTPWVSALSRFRQNWTSHLSESFWQTLLHASWAHKQSTEYNSKGKIEIRLIRQHSKRPDPRESLFLSNPPFLCYWHGGRKSVSKVCGPLIPNSKYCGCISTQFLSVFSFTECCIFIVTQDRMIAQILREFCWFIFIRGTKFDTGFT